MSSSAVQFVMRNHVNLAKLSLGTGFLWGFAFTLQKGQTPFDAAQGASLATRSSPLTLCIAFVLPTRPDTLLGGASGAKGGTTTMLKRAGSSLRISPSGVHLRNESPHVCATRGGCERRRGVGKTHVDARYMAACIWTGQGPVGQGLGHLGGAA